MDAQPSTPYRGRFAPSPTGPLHFGSLLTAVGSFADARSRQGEWLVRIEDLDSNRAVPGVDTQILTTLEAFGLFWDGPVRYQSQRTEAYETALRQLNDSGMTYPCACSRREIAAAGRAGPEGPIYPGTCRQGLPPGRAARALRLRVPDCPLNVIDRIQGTQRQNLAITLGDFILRRADGFHAYQLAVVVDDAEQGITEIVRGADLLQSTPRQCYLQGLLGLPRPSYAHLPLALNESGRKLSKSLGSLPVEPQNPLPALQQAWRFLGQPVFSEPPLDVADFWRQAIPRWSLSHVPRGATQPITIKTVTSA